jgi:hypothetical protein
MYRRYIAILGVFIFLLPGLAVGESESNDYLYTATIAQNGHFPSQSLYLDEGDQIQVKVMVISGGPIDVYIMTSQQYDLAYKIDNESIKTVSYLHSEENEREVEFTYEIPDFKNYNMDDYYYYDENFFDSIYLIVDNRNCSLTDYDANSVGVVNVKIDYKIKYSESDMIDPLEGVNIICGIMALVIIIIVIAIIFYFIRESRRNHKQMIQPVPQQHYYQYQYQYQPPTAPPPQPQYYQQYYAWPPPYGPPPQQQPEPTIQETYSKPKKRTAVKSKKSKTTKKKQ